MRRCLRFEDLSHLQGDAKEQALTAIAKQDRLQPFDLTQPGLMRLTLIKHNATLFTLPKPNITALATAGVSPCYSMPCMVLSSLVPRQPPRLAPDLAYGATQKFYQQQSSATGSIGILSGSAFPVRMIFGPC